MHKFVEEKEDANKEAIFGALSSFIRGLTHGIIEEFITKKNGAEFLQLILKDKTVSPRLQKKVLFFINNLV